MGLFGKGKIVLNLEKYKYLPGENIRGNIKLELKKPINARKLEIKLKGIRKDRVTPGELSAVTGGNRAKGTHTTKVYDSKKTIDGKKEYGNENYTFELEIPNNIFELAKLPIDNLSGKSEGIVKSMHLVSGHDTNIEWYISAQLDISLGKDVKEKKQIEISK